MPHINDSAVSVNTRTFAILECAERDIPPLRQRREILSETLRMNMPRDMPSSMAELKRLYSLSVTLPALKWAQIAEISSSLYRLTFSSRIALVSAIVSKGE